MSKFTVAGLAVCWACSAVWGQVSGGTTIGVPLPGPARMPGYNAPGFVPGGFMPGPPPGIVVLAPAHASHYNARVDFPPFTMVPDFTVFERRAMPPVTGTGTGTVTTIRERTLYDRLGGENAIRAVVDDFVTRALNDPKVNFTRKGTPAEWKATPENVDHVKKTAVELVGMVTGGPQRYTGKSMKEAHKGMEITQAEFDAFMADVKASLDKFNVPAKEQDELTKIVASTAPDIVEKKRN
jgi:truncated hemoglobin YjbI